MGRQNRPAPPPRPQPRPARDERHGYVPKNSAGPHDFPPEKLPPPPPPSDKK